MKNKKILIAEDELTNSILLKKILGREGFDIVSVSNGVDALKFLEKDKFDALLTDWMMPKMDGIELTRRIRETVDPPPLIIVITALASESAKNYAIESGADDYVAKPIDIEELVNRMKEGIARKEQESSITRVPVKEQKPFSLPSFIGVGLATSTGGPPAIIEIFRNISPDINAAFFIVQHGPAWMLETFCQRLRKETGLNLHLMTEETTAEKGNIYVAPGDSHLIIEPESFRVLLNDGPKENFVRPAADPLFRSLADSFGRYSVAVVLTGLGKDGVNGAHYLSSQGGLVVVQDPNTAVAPSMPKSLIDSGVECVKLPMTEIGKGLTQMITGLNKKLSKELSEQE